MGNEGGRGGKAGVEGGWHKSVLCNHAVVENTWVKESIPLIQWADSEFLFVRRFRWKTIFQCLLIFFHDFHVRFSVWVTSRVLERGFAKVIDEVSKLLDHVWAHLSPPVSLFRNFAIYNYGSNLSTPTISGIQQLACNLIFQIRCLRWICGFVSWTTWINVESLVYWSYVQVPTRPKSSVFFVFFWLVS